MLSKSNVHGPATFMQNTGFILPGFPSAGVWISYALGKREREPAGLRGAAGPARDAAERRGELVVRVPARGAPGHYDSRGQRRPRLLDLRHPHRRSFITPESERDGLALLDAVNREHRAQHGATRGWRRGSPPMRWRPGCS